MSEKPSIIWQGLSGIKYRYWIYPPGTTFKKQPGNYIFAREVLPGTWVPRLIGQTNNLCDRVEGHDEDECVKRYGLTYIHAHVNDGGESVRKAEEMDLVMLWKPPCNDQYVNE